MAVINHICTNKIHDLYEWVILELFYLCVPSLCSWKLAKVGSGALCGIAWCTSVLGMWSSSVLTIMQ